MKKNPSRKPQEPAADAWPQPPDIYTPPGCEKRGNETAARYEVTPYDKPIDLPADEHTELLLALFEAAKLLRKQAMKWRDHIDWSGSTGEQSESEIEERFRRANNCDDEAKLLLDEYRRGCRREWIAHFPRKGPQFDPVALRRQRARLDRRGTKRGKAARS